MEPPAGLGPMCHLLAPKRSCPSRNLSPWRKKKKREKSIIHTEFCRTTKSHRPWWISTGPTKTTIGAKAVEFRMPAFFLPTHMA